jgi:hypothetical protein
VLENPQHFSRARAGAGVKPQNFRGRGRARGSNLKIFEGAGGRGGKILKFSRARAGAGAKIFLAGGRGRAPARKTPHGRPRAPTRANLKIYNHFRDLNFGKNHYLILFLGKNNIFKTNKDKSGVGN